MNFRAAYWTNGKGAEVLLTLPEHSSMSDEALLAEARRYAEEEGFDFVFAYGNIVVGEWAE